MELLIAAAVGAAIVWLVLRRRSTPAVTATSPHRPRPGGLGLVGSLLFAGVVIGGTFYLFKSPATQQSEASKWTAPAQTSADPYDQTGCSASKRAVEARLRSPSTARWASCRVTTAAGAQTVTLVVDSQNASGGVVRSEWITTVRGNNVESIGQLR